MFLHENDFSFFVPLQTETDESIRIEELKKEVIDIEDEILRHSHYSRQLDHLLLRLRNNQLKFDAHMVTMEQTMPSILKVRASIRLIEILCAELSLFVLNLDRNKKM